MIFIREDVLGSKYGKFQGVDSLIGAGAKGEGVMLGNAGNDVSLTFERSGIYRSFSIG